MKDVAVFAAVAASIALASGASPASGEPIVFPHICSPAGSWVSPLEQPFRSSLCLNGRWQFQEVPVPAGFKPDSGEPPALPDPSPAWDSVPIKIPSPFNVNAWGNGRDVGEGTRRPYTAGSVYYPSYPARWDSAQMGWMRRTFRMPSWQGREILLHFDAVAGDCVVLVNGVEAGRHFDSFLPFDIDVTALTHPGDNELLVGVRAANLMNCRSAKYPAYIRPYPEGSILDSIAGIWQDVTLAAIPKVHIVNTFVQPHVDSGELTVTATVRNDSSVDAHISVGGTVAPWINEAGTDVIGAPEPRGRLGAPVMTELDHTVVVAAGKTATIRIDQPVGGRLKLWSPQAPNLYGLLLSVTDGGRTVDRYYTRFGYRQLKIAGRDLLLNGRKIQLIGDICHPFGPFMMSRRFAWAWFRMIKDYGGNAVRLHAQPYPPFYLDVADEMGIMVLDEDALFGSSISLNLDNAGAWSRFHDHAANLVLRDRNHPSVFGFSFGNEMFAVLSRASREDQRVYTAKLAALGKSICELDSTRQWISCDGDGDLGGALPVWSRHFGLGLHLDQLPDATVQKPLMVGESGGSYYATPSQMSVFNGDDAYRSYAGRNDALGIDVYQNVVKMARPSLAYFSASETVWFGLEPLAYGYTDVSRLPNESDGIFFGPYVEGQPGMQLERIPPYAGTLNPGWDPRLPLYKPLGMFEALKAACRQPQPQPCRWDHIAARHRSPAGPVAGGSAAGFSGLAGSDLARQLGLWGVELTGPSSPLITTLIVDGQDLSRQAIADTAKDSAAVLARGGTVWIMVRDSSAPVDLINSLLPAPAQLTARRATMLVASRASAWTGAFSQPDLYFAEDKLDAGIIKCGIGGDFGRRGDSLLEAANIDWSLFVNVPETAKCGAAALYERLDKPAGGALVAMPAGGGRIVLSSIDYLPQSSNYADFWRSLISRAGIAVGPIHDNWILAPAPNSRNGFLWRYVLDRPAGAWIEPAYDDSGWASGPAGFGDDVPGGVWRTPWRTDDIWLRTHFTATADHLKQVTMFLHHDEDVEVYVNGVEIYREPGFLTAYKPVPLSGAALAAFRAGDNVVAVHCRQTTGGQYVDVGFASGPIVVSGTAAAGHDLLLNGPQQ